MRAEKQWEKAQPFLNDRVWEELGDASRHPRGTTEVYEHPGLVSSLAFHWYLSEGILSEALTDMVAGTERLKAGVVM
jgi:hypothetical protein